MAERDTRCAKAEGWVSETVRHIPGAAGTWGIHDDPSYEKTVWLFGEARFPRPPDYSKPEHYERLIALARAVSWKNYTEALCDVVGVNILRANTSASGQYLDPCVVWADVVKLANATPEQRLEAACRVLEGEPAAPEDA